MVSLAKTDLSVNSCNVCSCVKFIIFRSNYKELCWAETVAQLSRPQDLDHCLPMCLVWFLVSLNLYMVNFFLSLGLLSDQVICIISILSQTVFQCPFTIWIFPVVSPLSPHFLPMCLSSPLFLVHWVWFFSLWYQCCCHWMLLLLKRFGAAVTSNAAGILYQHPATAAANDILCVFILVLCLLVSSSSGLNGGLVICCHQRTTWSSASSSKQLPLFLLTHSLSIPGMFKAISVCTCLRDSIH